MTIRLTSKASHRHPTHSLLHPQTIDLALLLSALAGFVDAIGYLRLGGFFVSFMSGNTTRLGIALGGDAWRHAGISAGLILTFILGVMGGSYVNKRAGIHRRSAVLALVAACLGLSAVSHSLGIYLTCIGGMTLAMGAENAVFRHDGDVKIGLTYMTGTLVKMASRLVDPPQDGSDSGSLQFLMIWLAFLVGATLGAIAHQRVGMTSLWFVTAYAVTLTLISLLPARREVFAAVQ